MILIGNKIYNNIKLNSIIDTFDKNIRFNFGLPNNNNGTKKYIQYLNVHVYTNVMNNNDIIKKYEKYTDNVKYLNNFNKLFIKKDYKKIIKQNNSKKNHYNNFLKKIKCPYLFSKLPRLGCNALMDYLTNNIKNIYLTNYSLSKKENYIHLYNNKLFFSSIHHCIEDEMKIIKWLHNNNYIDASMCSLKDNILPLFDCKNIKPTIKILNLFLKEYGICILINYFNEKEIFKFNTEFDNIFIQHKDDIQILDKEECSNDERIFYAEKYSNYIKKNFSNNNLFTNCAKLYRQNLNKKTLINKLTYEKDKIKNSGAGWHRDNHECQFKAIMYLTDVSEDNGNFQFLTNSNKKCIGYPKPRTKNYNTRFTDKTVEELLKNNNKIQLCNIIGKAGTIILVNTTYIQRGNIIKKGIRKALTQYFF